MIKQNIFKKQDGGEIMQLGKLLILPLVLILMAGAALAASTCSVATAGTYDGSRNDATYGDVWSGVVNITIAATNTGFNNVSNCSMTIVTRSGFPATANISESIVTGHLTPWNYTNGNAAARLLNYTWNTAYGNKGTYGMNSTPRFVEDGAYTVTVTCYNDSSSSQGTCTATRNIYIDNTKPGAISYDILSPADGAKDDDGDVTYDLTTAAGNTTSCVLNFDPAGVSPSISPTSQIELNTGKISYELKDLANTGEGYVIYWTCSDGINITTAAKRTLYVDDPSGKLTAMYVMQQQQGQDTSGTSGSKAIWIVAIAVGIWLFGTKSGAQALKQMKLKR